jgi:hypothetical protein
MLPVFCFKIKISCENDNKDLFFKYIFDDIIIIVSFLK